MSHFELSHFELALMQLFEGNRGVHTTEPIDQQPYWKDIQRLKQLAYFEVAAQIAEGKMP